MTSAVTEITDRLGVPTVLVNNAGILRDNLLHKMSDDDWDLVLDVHLRGAFLMSRACQSGMRDAGFGRIVNLSSTSALGNRGQANYAAAKAGMQGLTKTLAIELGRFGVTANAIAPGFIETEMTRATATRMRIDYETLRAAAVGTIPVGRVGQPEDIAAVASFLCSARGRLRQRPGHLRGRRPQGLTGPAARALRPAAHWAGGSLGRFGTCARRPPAAAGSGGRLGTCARRRPPPPGPDELVDPGHRLAEDGPELLGGGAAGVAEIDLVMPAGHPQTAFAG